MSYAQKLITQGISQGLSQGVSQGALIGQLQLMQRMLGMPVQSMDELKDIDSQIIRARFDELEAEYNARYKRA
jgi:hypothetical protein